MSRWFRMYDSAVDDPKIQRLSGDTFKAWVNILCLTSRSGGCIPPKADIAFSLRKTVKQVEVIVAELLAKELLDVVGNSLKPHNWNGRQFKSDVTDSTAAERMRNYRNRNRNAGRNASVSVTVPRADSDQITDQNRDTKPSVLLRAKPSKGSRLEASFEPNEADISDLETRGFPRDRHALEAEKFRNHWLASSGANAVKRDWHRAYRNWCLRSLEMGGPGPVFPTSALITAGFYAAQGSAELERWTDYRLRTDGRSPPRDKNGGWTFPDRWPPDYQQSEAAA